MKNTRLTTNPLLNHALCVFIRHVSVSAGTTRTCVSTCARGAGTHGDVMDGHTPHTTPHHKTQHNTTQHNMTHHTETEKEDRERLRGTEKRKTTETEREKRRRKTEEDKTWRREGDKTRREEKRRDKRQETRDETRREKMKKETREENRTSRDQENQNWFVLIIVLRRWINLTIQRLNCRFPKIIH